ncbi:MAG TPA: TetR/AcrR family transcriptional regulator [Ohtaekwangia sp.]|uniref:TetR/AcrR family transcriptional regulator n=1 Tax=Ohtaekwangia sp. TaxID=2066019 RepID=UPI002F95D58C
MPKAELTKALIIEKTASVFNKKGFAGTSLTDIEEATGLTKGSIYSNFTSKDDVALAVFDYNLKTVNTIVNTEMSRYSSSRERLMAYVKVYGKHVLDHPFPAGGCPILNTAIDADDTHPELRKRASAAVIAWKDTVVGLIRKGIREGEFTGSIDPEETALTMVATIEGAVMISKVTGKIAFLKTVMKSVENMINDL